MSFSNKIKDFCCFCLFNKRPSDPNTSAVAAPSRERTPHRDSCPNHEEHHQHADFYWKTRSGSLSWDKRTAQRSNRVHLPITESSYELVRTPKPRSRPHYFSKHRKMVVTEIKDKEDFNEKLEKCGDLLVVVDFHAKWCGPCKMIAPKIEEMAFQFQNVAVFLKVDVDECEELATLYDIVAMPTFLFIRNKQVIGQFSGANYEKIRDFVTQNT